MKIPTDNFERLADRLEQWATEYEALAAKADAVKVHPHSATRWRGRAQGYRSAAQLIRDEIRRENERILSAECGWCGQTAEMDATGRILSHPFPPDSGLDGPCDGVGLTLAEQWEQATFREE